MNIEQAIAIFERAMRLRDPALLTPECCEIALSALREKAERENPKPLTLEEVAELAKAKRRADKAVEDLNTLRKKSRWTCFACKYDASYVREICAGCGYNDNWEWRGDAEDGENETTVAYFTLCKDNELGYVYKCASCGNEMYGNMPKYCSECGKRIVEGDAE